jgi:hypothetical protein
MGVVVSGKAFLSSDIGTTGGNKTVGISNSSPEDVTLLKQAKMFLTPLEGNRTGNGLRCEEGYDYK